VQNIFGKPSKRNRALESDSEKEETEKQWTDSIQSQPCRPLIDSFTGGGKLLQPQTTSQRRLNPFH
jgi:hypothetical protein